jgi:hypothetical protein
MDDDKKIGVKAIIFLQSMVGITETEEDAEKGWEGMTESEQETTLKTYEMFKDLEGVDWTKEPEERG